MRLGFAGLGAIAHNHAAHAQALDATVACGLDPDGEARARFAEAFDADTETDMAALLAHDPDALVVTTPNCFHEEYAVAALEAGVHVLCEKPLAHTVKSAERIVAAAAAAEAFLMVGFNNRFSGAAQVTAEAIATGRLGEITHIEANFIRRRGVPGRGSWFTTQARAGGGALVDIGVHALDLALALADFPTVESVSGQTRAEFAPRPDYAYAGMYGADNGPEGVDVEDRATGVLRCAGGATISLDVAWAANRPPSKTIIVEGTDAGAQFELGGDEVTFYEVDREAAADPLSTETVTVDAEPSHRRELAAFSDCIRAGTPPEVNTPTQALVVQRVVDAFYRSAASGQPQAPQADSHDADHVPDDPLEVISSD